MTNGGDKIKNPELEASVDNPRPETKQESGDYPSDKTPLELGPEVTRPHERR